MDAWKIRPYFRFSRRFCERLSEMGLQKKRRNKIIILFILCNELKNQCAEINSWAAILAVCIAKFGPLREPIRILLSIVNLLSHVLNYISITQLVDWCKSCILIGYAIRGLLEMVIE